ncbi:hypothetical protein WMY93_008033 [Mugilogobius chulae]|uniref:Uncharacterized protein n=1 Tax=Mugilogobius chulae TaxID=88201 RepID=A0AAW0PNL4_9GOBI
MQQVISLLDKYILSWQLSLPLPHGLRALLLHWAKLQRQIATCMGLDIRIGLMLEAYAPTDAQNAPMCIKALGDKDTLYAQTRFFEFSLVYKRLCFALGQITEREDRERGCCIYKTYNRPTSSSRQRPFLCPPWLLQCHVVQQWFKHNNEHFSKVATAAGLSFHFRGMRASTDANTHCKYAWMLKTRQQVIDPNTQTRLIITFCLFEDSVQSSDETLKQSTIKDQD